MIETQQNLLPLIAVIGIVGLLPLAVVTMTGFLKISVVLFLVRNALGIQQMPPNLVLYGIALVLTVFVTTPMLTEIQRTLVEGQAKFDTADDIVRSAELVREPIKRQLVRFTKPEERSFFQSATQRLWPDAKQHNVRDDDLSILIPAFVASELTRAFEIGLLLYLPFLVIDLVVANILMTLGMIMVSPVLISIPLKLFLFVAIDGWSRLMHGLILSYS
ncbi:EscR/YscR/HrcR family type III secretion system export apparatus protein [Brucella tritici]|jgi:type III secretion protein R|uniref:EscR/YscR/HrcR family type III secretion system export apparatus protein n=2 Tax=Brucella TaxID=234 RepID=A0A6L3Y8X3_9HYPH|nr:MULTISPECIES: type III secretion system export apparatus subunit SctR [Brucella]KAB2661833.1 EscR/YscR/HrcR family type III secretion system export apparatus protein [Brucella tritici]KAB2676348.1 EscR/YscR/HrcR family type III secretion system export apparatus protein [Brucella tritici]OIS93613.1 EscR/YscR/HrcR family type III secretion system export apparatus protein [Brucella cytisi]